MTRYLLIVAPLMMGCSALAQPPVPSLSPARTDQAADAAGATDPASSEDDIDAEVREALSSIDPRVTSDADEEAATDRTTTLRGELAQGGLVFGETAPGSTVQLVTYGDNGQITDSRTIEVDEYGNFLLGFDRDHGPEAVLMVTYPGEDEPDARPLKIAPREWRESRIDGVDENKVNPYKPEDLEKIVKDKDLKSTARRTHSNDALWLTGFEWPAEGCISSVFGSRRIVNGTPKRFHSGVDIAAPDGESPMDYIGTEVRAPADGIIRLASSDMFFEGGLIFIDHGQGLYSYLMHLSSVDVPVGKEVHKGDPIGKIGMTGRVTGPHLHWSLKWQDVLLDPADVVPPRPACTD